MLQNTLFSFSQLTQNASPEEVSTFLYDNWEVFFKNDSSYITIGTKNAIMYGNFPVLEYLFNRKIEFNIDVFKLYEGFSSNIRYCKLNDNFKCIDYVLKNTPKHNVKKLTYHLYDSLKTACEDNNLKGIDYLLNQQKVVDLRVSHDNYKNILPIFSYANLDVLEYFFKNANPKHRLDPLVLNNRGLYLAAKTDSVDAVEYLLNLNKNFITSEHVNIALIKATIYEGVKVVRFLINDYQIVPNNRLEYFLHKNLTQDSFHNKNFIEYVKKLLDNQALYKKLQKNINETNKNELKKKKI